MHINVSKIRLWDWVALIAIIVVALPFEGPLEPNHRRFRLDNPAIQYPMSSHEHVPNWMLAVLVFFIPLAGIAGLCTVQPRLRRSVELSVLAFLFAIALNTLVTGVLKNVIGNTRPDFLARCVPARGSPTDVYLTADACTTANKAVLAEGFRSSPSGHSSHSFCGLGFLGFWLFNHVGVFGTLSTIPQILSFLSPFFLATLIAASRIVDYRHHWYDVFAGSTIGLSVAALAYYQYFTINLKDARDAREEIPV